MTDADGGSTAASDPLPEKAGASGTDAITALSALALQERLRTGELSAAAVLEAYLSRIEDLNVNGPALRAVLAINPEAAGEAARLDAALSESGPAGPLHGIPVLIKGNIDVAGMSNSAGSLALADNVPGKDAHLVAALRQAGAVILGTANLSEWANFRDDFSSSGWSSVGGQTRNPHVLDRNPCGSSSGSAVAVAARMAPLAVGTETNGSIVCPATMNGVVGIKPTVGLVSRSGIIPISSTQDTAGPMARNVADAALLLEALAAYDPEDPLSIDSADLRLPQESSVSSLSGKRIGVLRSYSGKGRYAAVEAVYTQSLAALEGLGATLVDPVEYTAFPDIRKPMLRIMLREFKAGLNDYLSHAGLPAERSDLAALIAYNVAEAERVMPHFGQSVFLDSEAQTGLDDPEYAADIAAAQEKLRADLKALFADNALDAIVMPTNGPAWKTDWVYGDTGHFGGTAYLAAVSGFPSLVLPAGVVEQLPIGVGLLGLPETEAGLIQLALALEAALPPAPEPGFIDSLESQASR